jgi:hypothetical protein
MGVGVSESVRQGDREVEGTEGEKEKKEWKRVIEMNGRQRRRKKEKGNRRKGLKERLRQRK